MKQFTNSTITNIQVCQKLLNSKAKIINDVIQDIFYKPLAKKPNY